MNAPAPSQIPPQSQELIDKAVQKFGEQHRDVIISMYLLGVVDGVLCMVNGVCKMTEAVKR